MKIARIFRKSIIGRGFVLTLCLLVGLSATAADMAKWVQVQLNRGKFMDRDGRLFSEQRSREMWTPQTILPIGDPPTPLAALKPNFSDYALGWGLPIFSLIAAGLASVMGVWSFFALMRTISASSLTE